MKNLVDFNRFLACEQLAPENQNQTPYRSPLALLGTNRRAYLISNHKIGGYSERWAQWTWGSFRILKHQVLDQNSNNFQWNNNNNWTA